MQAVKSGKRKARCEEGEEGRTGSKPAGLSRKAVKRAQGHTPSRKGSALGHKGNSPGPASHGTPLRHVNGPRVAAGPSRLANSTCAADVGNAARAANGNAATQVCASFNPLPESSCHYFECMSIVYMKLAAFYSSC